MTTSARLSLSAPTDEDLLKDDDGVDGGDGLMDEIDEEALLGGDDYMLPPVTTTGVTRQPVTGPPGGGGVSSLNSIIDTVADKILGDLCEDGAGATGDGGANGLRLTEEETEELDYDDEPDHRPTGNNDRREVGGGGNSYEDDEEEEVVPQRDKFKSERSFADPPTVVQFGVGTGMAGSGGTTVSFGGSAGHHRRVNIPDSLDDVRIKLTNRRNARHGQDAHGKVLLNPFYRGSVPADPNIRLRWDANQQMNHVGVVKIQPCLPPNGRTTGEAGFAMPPGLRMMGPGPPPRPPGPPPPLPPGMMLSGGGMPPPGMVPVLSTMPLQPGTMTPYGFVTAAGQVLVGGPQGFPMPPPPPVPGALPPAVSAAPPTAVSHGFIGFGPPPSQRGADREQRGGDRDREQRGNDRDHRSSNRDGAPGIPPLIPRQAVGDASTGGGGGATVSAANWDFAVAEFVSRNAAKGDRGKYGVTAPKSMDQGGVVRRRDRDDQTSRRRERRSRSRTRSRTRSRSRSVERTRRRSVERGGGDSGSRRERQQKATTELEMKAAKQSAKELGLEDDYFEKLETQRQMRDAMMEQKKLKREMEVKNRRRDDDAGERRGERERDAAKDHTAKSSGRSPPKSDRVSSSSGRQNKAHSSAGGSRSNRREESSNRREESSSRREDTSSSRREDTSSNRREESSHRRDDQSSHRRERDDRHSAGGGKMSVSPSEIQVTSSSSRRHDGGGEPPRREQDGDAAARRIVDSDTLEARRVKAVTQGDSTAAAGEATPAGGRAAAAHEGAATTGVGESAVGKKMIAAVVRNFIDKPGLLDRMRLIAETVGDIKRCDRPAVDAIVVVFVNVNHAAQFVKQYHGKTLNGAKISVTLENYIILK